VPVFRFVTDEDFDANVTRGVLAQLPDLDVVRVQDVGLSGAPDPEILAWAAAEGRILLTHDVSTMTGYAIQRVQRGEALPGVVVVPQRLRVGRAIEDLLLLIEAGDPSALENQLCFLPL
jgi:hypothetical protein